MIFSGLGVSSLLVLRYAHSPRARFPPEEDPNTDTLEPVEITINTLESAYKKYYRINGGN